MIDEKILDRYEKLLRLEEGGATEGEKEAARVARVRLEKKYPELTIYFAEPDTSSHSDYDHPGWQPSAAEPDGPAWGWDRVANMAGSFFSQMKDYAEFAWGLSFARGMADRVNVALRKNASGSLTVNARIEPREARHLSQFTPEQKAAFAQAVAEKVYQSLMSR